MRDVIIPRDLRLYHLYISGLSGYGKTTLLHHMALDDMAQGYGLAILDPKGSLVDQVISYIPKNRISDVIYIDGLSEIPIDFLHWETIRQCSNLADDLMVIIERLSENASGDQWKSILQWTIHTILEARGSFLDIYYFLTDDEKKRKILLRVKNVDIHQYWDKQYPKLTGKSENSITTRMAKFLLEPSLKAMLGNAQAKLHIPTAIKEEKIILINLAKVGERAANVIGTLFVSQIQQAIFKRVPEHYGYPYYLYVDEFQDFKSEAFSQILKKARGFGLGLTLVSLHPKQLGDLIDDVKGCVTSYIFFRMDAEQARLFKTKLLPYEAEYLEELHPFECIYRGQSNTSYEVFTDRPPDDPTPEQKELARTIRQNTIDNYLVPDPSAESGTNRNPQPSPSHPPQKSDTEGNGNRTENNPTAGKEDPADQKSPNVPRPRS